MNESVTLFECANHTIVVTEDGTFIYTNEKQKHLEDIKPAIRFINNHILSSGDIKLYSVIYETKTLDYIKDIEEVERYTKDLRIDRNIVQEYNKKRDSYEDKLRSRYEEFEHYKAKYESNYYTENGFCSKKQIEFSNAEYYDDTIGIITTTIQTKLLNTENNYHISLLNVLPSIDELKKENTKIFKDSFKEEYLKRIYK